MENSKATEPRTPLREPSTNPSTPITPRTPFNPIVFGSPLTTTKKSSFVTVGQAIPGSPTTRSPSQYKHEPVFDKEGFSNIVHNIAHTLIPDFDLEDEAIVALQAAAEAMLVKEFGMINSVALHSARDIITEQDVDLIQMLRARILGLQSPGAKR